MPLTVQAEEEAAAGPLPAGWEKIRRGRAVHYRHVASGNLFPFLTTTTSRAPQLALIGQKI